MMSHKVTFRLAFVIAGLGCLGLLATGYVLEFGLGMEPCSLCLLQRYVFYILAGIFFLGALHYPNPIGRLVYCFVQTLFSLIGIALSARHLWIQYIVPPDHNISCTAGLEQLLEMKPFLVAIKEVLLNSQDCSKIDTLFSIPLSAWSMLGFGGLLMWVLLIGYLQIKRRI